MQPWSNIPHAFLHKIYLNKKLRFGNSLARSSTRHHEDYSSTRLSASKVITSGTYWLRGVWSLKLNIEARGLKVTISAFIFEITGTQTYVIIIEQPIHQWKHHISETFEANEMMLCW